MGLGRRVRVGARKGDVWVIQLEALPRTTLQPGKWEGGGRSYGCVGWGEEVGVWDVCFLVPQIFTIGKCGVIF